MLSQRTKLPTVTMVFLLLPDAYRPLGDNLRWEALGRATQQLAIEEVRLWEQEPEPWWKESPGMMALYPLTKHGRRPKDAVTHAARSIARTSKDRRTRADMLTVLGIYGKLKWPGLDVFHLIGSEEMKESKFYQEIMEEGRIHASRAAVSEALLLRHGKPVADELQPILETIHDEKELTRLLRLAIQSSSPAEFREGLKVKKTSRSKRG